MKPRKPIWTRGNTHWKHAVQIPECGCWVNNKDGKLVLRCEKHRKEHLADIDQLASQARDQLNKANTKGVS